MVFSTRKLTKARNGAKTISKSSFLKNVKYSTVTRMAPKNPKMTRHARKKL